MVKTKTRKWCEGTAEEFGCNLEQVNGEWRVVQRSTKKVAYKSKYLIDVQKYLLNEIAKYLGKRMGVRKE